MTESTERQRELAAFLRSRRERRLPESVGLDPAGRRRTPGLRREELAALAGVSASWYTWLEQGRRIRVSRQVLSGLAAALGLDPVECSHLFVLAGEVPPGGGGPVAAEVPEGYRLLLDQLDPSPAFLTNRRFDVLAWNRGQIALFGDPGAVEPDERNVLWLLFMSPETRELYVDWEAEAAHAVALFRSQAGERLMRPEFMSLVGRLERASEEFRAMWDRRDLVAYAPGPRVFHHPALGKIALESVKMHAADGVHTLVAHLAPPGSQLAAELPALVARQRGRTVPGAVAGVTAAAPPAAVSEKRAAVDVDQGAADEGVLQQVEY